MGSIQEWAGVYPLFHWSFIPWGFYLVLAAAFGFMLHVRKRDRGTGRPFQFFSSNPQSNIHARHETIYFLFTRHFFWQKAIPRRITVRNPARSSFPAYCFSSICPRALSHSASRRLSFCVHFASMTAALRFFLSLRVISERPKPFS